MANVIETNPFRRYWDDPNGFESICRKYVIASILYYHHNFGPVEDSRFDNWALTLKMKFNELPQWFKERVSYSDLCAGTGFRLQPTEEEAEIVRGYLEGRFDPNTTF